MTGNNHVNNRAISLATRSWLYELAARNEISDEKSVELLLPVIAAVSDNHPGSLVFGLAVELGASIDQATTAGSVAELFHASCSYIDDIQDGDTDEYLPDIALGTKINLQVHLLSLIASRVRNLNSAASDSDTALGTDTPCISLFEDLASMLVGQRMEIARQNWDIHQYEIVARRISGQQFAAYCRLSAYVSDADPQPVIRWGHAFGNLVQIVVDSETNDSRFLRFSASERLKLHQKFNSELESATTACSCQFIHDQTLALRKRWTSWRKK